MKRRAALLLLMALAAAALPAGASADTWRPDVRDARAYAAQRQGVVSFSVRTPARAWGWHRRSRFSSASVVKAMILVAYLRRDGVRRRLLRRSERALLAPMIRRSDNGAATRLLSVVRPRGLRRFARRAGMRRFSPAWPIWGHSRITAADQTRFFLRIDRLLPPRHRAYGMRLLGSIVERQRWGIARVRLPRGWRLYFKGGWGSGTGLVDHQVGLLRRGDQRVALAVLTRGNPSHAYGNRTLRGVAWRLLRGLPRRGPVR